MVTFTLAGIEASPMCLTDEKGNSCIINTRTNKWTEEIARSITMACGGSVSVILYPVIGKQLKKYGIRNIVTKSEEIGRTIREIKKCENNPEDEFLKAIEGYKLFKGKIVDIRRETKSGFNYGEVIFEGIGECKGSKCSVTFQNENMCATSDDIYSGILNSLHQVLVDSKVNPKDVSQAMIGTTQCTNAIVERKKLSTIGIIRLGAPAATAISPMIDWPEEFEEYVEEAIIIKGGYEFDGREIMPLDIEEARRFFERIKGKVSAVAISCVFSPVRSDHEYVVANIAREVLGSDIHISLSSEIGSLSLIERENACILNAMLHEVSKSFTEGFHNSLLDEGVTNAELYLSQNDGMLMTAEYARKYPILTV
ncbi:MAG: DUF917 family protein, partial [Clostridium sp.]